VLNIRCLLWNGPVESTDTWARRFDPARENQKDRVCTRSVWVIGI